MRTHESDKSDTPSVVEAYDKPVPVPANIEYDPVLANDACIPVVCLHRTRRCPLGFRRDRIPRLERLFCSVLRFPKRTQSSLRHNPHTCISVYPNKGYWANWPATVPCLWGMAESLHAAMDAGLNHERGHEATTQEAIMGQAGTCHPRWRTGPDQSYAGYEPSWRDAGQSCAGACPVRWPWCSFPRGQRTCPAACQPS